MADRIDYLKIALVGTPTSVLAEREWYQGIALQNVSEGYRSSVPYKSWPSKRSTASEWVEIFECWGPSADSLAQSLSPSVWSRVSRIDYRVEFAVPQYTLLEVEQCAREATQGTMSISRQTSRPRTKRGGRDAGGEFIGLGSHASDRRVTIYQRGREPWATELQVSDKHCLAVVTEAGRRYSEQAVPTMYEAIGEVMFEMLQVQMTERTGLPFRVVAGLEPRADSLPTDPIVLDPVAYGIDLLAQAAPLLSVEDTMSALSEVYPIHRMLRALRAIQEEREEPVTV